MKTQTLDIRAVQPFSLRPSNLSEAMEFAKLMAASRLVPKDFQGQPADILVAVQLGMELGLPPLQALQNISVINGRPCVWGDAALALVQSSGLLEDIQETDDGKTATCKVVRRGISPITRTFSMEDAQRAGLAGKGPWTQYPARMRQMRARAFALRDGFADVLKGMAVREEIEDYPTRVPLVPVEATAQMVDIPAAVSQIDALMAGKPVEPVQAEPKPENGNKKISSSQQKRLFSIATASGWTSDEVKIHLKGKHGIEHSIDIPAALYDQVIAEIQAGGKVEEQPNA